VLHKDCYGAVWNTYRNLTRVRNYLKFTIIKLACKDHKSEAKQAQSSLLKYPSLATCDWSCGYVQLQTI